MSQILVEFDPTLEQSEIIMPLGTPGPDEVREDQKDKNFSGKQQSLVYGIVTPIIAINNTVIGFDDVIEMVLDDTGVVPELRITVNDTSGTLVTVDTPGVDNELRIQILPPYDNAYKKINLTFYLQDIRINDTLVSATGLYKVPELVSDNIKSFGETNTYDLFKQIAEETGLGFATNVKSNDADKRFVYCDNKSYLDLMEQQVKFSGDVTSNVVYDYWIDYWNNLNFADIYERYHAVDPDEDMVIWTSGEHRLIDEGQEIKPLQIAAVLTNHPALQANDLYVTGYSMINDSNRVTDTGTDMVASIYETTKGEYLDHLIQDGHVKKDVFTKYKYLGECYGESNYIMNKIYRYIYMNSIMSEQIAVFLAKPMLGLMRGHQCRFNWYFNDDKKKTKIENMEEAGVITKSSETVTNVDVDPETPYDEGVKNQGGTWVVDRTISGQYLIVGSKISYLNGEWKSELRLVRPADTKPKRIPENAE